MVAGVARDTSFIEEAYGGVGCHRVTEWVTEWGGDQGAGPGGRRRGGPFGATLSLPTAERFAAQHNNIVVGVPVVPLQWIGPGARGRIAWGVGGGSISK